MTKDEAVAFIIDAWDTNALCLHESCLGDEWDKLIEAIEVLRT